MQEFLLTLLKDSRGSAMILMGLFMAVVMVGLFALTLDHGQNYAKQSDLEGELRNNAQFLAADYSYYQCQTTPSACVTTSYSTFDSLYYSGSSPINPSAVTTTKLANGSIATLQSALQTNLQAKFGSSARALVQTGTNANNQVTLTFYGSVAMANNFKKGTTAANCPITAGTPPTVPAGCELNSVMYVTDVISGSITGVCQTNGTENQCASDTASLANNYCCARGRGMIANFVNNAGVTSWTCLGANGGPDASCPPSGTPVTNVSAACGNPDSSNPAAQTCLVGNLTSGSTASGTWQCTGTNGVPVSCSSSAAINAVCGTTPSPTNLACIMGKFQLNSDITTGSTATWICNGINGGNTAFCNNLINGTCSATTAGSCNTGVNPSGTGAYTDNTSLNRYEWNCNGINGGSNASCTRNHPAPPPACTCPSPNPPGDLGACGIDLVYPNPDTVNCPHDTCTKYHTGICCNGDYMITNGFCTPTNAGPVVQINTGSDFCNNGAWVHFASICGFSPCGPVDPVTCAQR